jgi:hypothetical protein
MIRECSWWPTSKPEHVVGRHQEAAHRQHVGDPTGIAPVVLVQEIGGEDLRRGQIGGIGLAREPFGERDVEAFERTERGSGGPGHAVASRSA